MLSEGSMYCTHGFAAITDGDKIDDDDITLVCRNDKNDVDDDDDDYAYTEDRYQDPYMDEAARLCKYKGWWIMELYYPTTEKLKFFENLKLNDTDVILTGFPKSGTTWLQEIIYRIACYQPSSGATSQENQEQLKIVHRFPTLEGDLSDFIERNKDRSPRLFKSHLPYSLLPKEAKAGNGKIIHIARNPKDVLVSYYHFSQYLLCMNYKGDFKDMFNSFMNGTVAFGPWLNHVEEYWHHRADKNVLFITYEELHRKTSTVIQKITEFLGMTLSAEQLSELIQSTSFQAMKNDNSVNFSWLKEIGLATKGDFMRKGEVGDWRNHFTEDMNERMERECLQPLRKQQLTFEDDT